MIGVACPPLKSLTFGIPSLRTPSLLATAMPAAQESSCRTVRAESIIHNGGGMPALSSMFTAPNLTEPCKSFSTFANSGANSWRSRPYSLLTHCILGPSGLGRSSQDARGESHTWHDPHILDANSTTQTASSVSTCVMRSCNHTSDSPCAM